MGRPWKRICANPICDNEFKTRSNGRIYCYSCSGSRDAKEVEQRKVNRQKEIRQNMTQEENILADALAKANEIESASRQNPTKLKIGSTSMGDRVVMAGRPEKGWGKCAFVDPMEGFDNCTKERFFEGTSFCDYHLRILRDIQARKTAAKISPHTKDEKHISINRYKIKKAADAADLLATVAKNVDDGFMTTQKAECIIKVVEAQMKALRQKQDEEKTAAEIRLLKTRAAIMLKKAEDKGDGGDEVLSEEDRKELQELAKRHGIDPAAKPE